MDIPGEMCAVISIRRLLSADYSLHLRSAHLQRPTQKCLDHVEVQCVPTIRLFEE